MLQIGKLPIFLQTLLPCPIFAIISRLMLRWSKCSTPFRARKPRASGGRNLLVAMPKVVPCGSSILVPDICGGPKLVGAKPTAFLNGKSPMRVPIGSAPKWALSSPHQVTKHKPFSGTPIGRRRPITTILRPTVGRCICACRPRSGTAGHWRAFL